LERYFNYWHYTVSDLQDVYYSRFYSAGHLVEAKTRSARYMGPGMPQGGDQRRCATYYRG
jgi:hypothetical protein